jgi:hypothetical protein
MSKLKIHNEFGECCDTCKYRPFGGGYSGRKNCGYCCVVKAVVCRSSLCICYEKSEKTIRRSVGGMKGQARWFENDIEHIEHGHKYKIKKGLYE